MLRLAFSASFFVVAASLAQVQIDERPKFLEPKTPSKEELKQQEANQLLRHAKTLYAVGVIRQRQDKLLEAATTLEKAAAIDPTSIEIQKALVPIYVAIGREGNAISLCRGILDQDPHEVEIAFQFARLLKHDARPAEAITVLQRGVMLKEAQARPERLLYMLSDLYELLDKKGDHAEAAKAQEAIIRTIEEKREQLLFGHGFLREDLQATQARAYERLGRARVQTKEFDKATTAFRSARETLLKCEDADSRHQAIRMSWNLSEIAMAQEKWAEALESLDAYLEYSPVEVEPYEKKIELLRKLGRERDVIPAIKRYAGRDQYHIGLQLVLARELGRDAASHKHAETLYLSLLETNIKPDIYRGLFRLYQSEDRMKKVLDMFDESLQKASATGEDVKPETREAAQERSRVMLSVLQAEPKLVADLLPEALAELRTEKARTINTWMFLAALAARTRQLKEAETLFRQCLLTPSPEHEYKIYSGLLDLLHRQRKNKEIVTLCQDALNGRLSARNTNAVLFETNLAAALADLGKFEEALQHADKAIKLSSEDSKVFARCRRAEILARNEKYDDSLRECEETMKEFPQTNRVRAVRYALSNTYSLKGDYAKSEEQLRLILETDPDAVLANNNLGYQMADRNVNLDEAERLIRRAMEVDRELRRDSGETDDNAAYIDSLGWVLFRKGKLDDARDWLVKAAALPDGADDPTVWDHLGDVYAKLNLPAKAKEAWQTASKLYSTSSRRKDEVRGKEVEKKLKTVE